MYSSKLSVFQRFSMSVTWNILWILPCSVSLTFITLLKNQIRLYLPGTLELLTFIYKPLVFKIHTLANNPTSKYWSQNTPRTSSSNVSRISSKDSIWPSRGRPDLTSWGRPNLMPWGCPEMTFRCRPVLIFKGHLW